MNVSVWCVMFDCLCVKLSVYLTWCFKILIAALESISVDSDDFVEEIGAHIQENFRFRKFANEAFKAEGAWLVHNRSLEEAFGKARKRLQQGDGVFQSKVAVSTQYGFLFTKDWHAIEFIACNGLKTGNLQDTWLGKPSDGKPTVKNSIAFAPHLT